ncbi:MAG: nitroreductase family protein [Spirochaetes bacterium]|nr:nitroreductase family protein [Spirochaetota bacterium]
MKITGFDEQKCTKCGLCSKDCMADLIDFQKGNLPVFNDPLEICIQCGHCIAVCPTNAIQYDLLAPDSEREYFSGIDHYSDSENGILKTLLNRRSVRFYQTKSVDKKVLEQIIDTMGRAPTASNKQNRNFYILSNPELVKRLEKKVSSFFLFLLKLSDQPVIHFFKTIFFRKRQFSFGDQYSKIKQNHQKMINKIGNQSYQFLFNAPAAIIITAPPKIPSNYHFFLKPDAYTCAFQGILTAESLGLGTCWIGFAEIAMEKNRKIKKAIGIPVHEQILAVFTLGYPAVSYHRAPPRGPVKIKWLD